LQKKNGLINQGSHHHFIFYLGSHQGISLLGFAARRTTS